MLFVNTLALALACVLSSSDTKTIPLDQIWAWEMPGTKKVRELSPVDTTLPTKQVRENSPAHDIVMTLNRQARDMNHKAGKGFVVLGVGRQALDAARDIITGKSKASASVTSDEELTLVFFTKAIGRKLYIRRVTCEKQEFTVSFYTHGTGEMGLESNFALVPLGKLSAGTYSVKISQSTPSAVLGTSPKSMSAELLKRFVCDSFVFTVTDTSSED